MNKILWDLSCCIHSLHACKVRKYQLKCSHSLKSVVTRVKKSCNLTICYHITTSRKNLILLVHSNNKINELDAFN